MPKIGPLPGHVVDAARVSAMLDHVARSLFVGVLNDGFFDPATGLCLSAKADRSAPAMAQCRPTVARTPASPAGIGRCGPKAVEDVSSMLSQKRLSAPQLLALKQEFVRIKCVLRGDRAPVVGGGATGRGRGRFGVRDGPEVAREARAPVAERFPMAHSFARSARADVYTRITDEIIAAIEKGAGEWRMPWHHDGGSVTRPRNVASDKPYRGINILALWVAATRSGYASGTWGTYRQWAERGFQVRRRETATPSS